jgi:hypothetical protein
MRTLGAALLALPVAIGFLALAPQDAHATAYTLSAGFSDTQGGTTVMFNQDFTTSGSTTCVSPICDLVNDDFLVFTVSVSQANPGADPDIDFITQSIFSFTQTVVGVGYFDGVGGSQPSGGSEPAATQARWDFATNLTDGDTSAPLFVTWTPSLNDGDTASFMANAVGAGLAGGSITITVVPEPSTLSLAALGIAALAAGRPRRRR